MEGKKSTVRPNGTDSARVIQVIETKSNRGKGTLDDLSRQVAPMPEPQKECPYYAANEVFLPDIARMIKVLQIIMRPVRQRFRL